MSFKEKFIAFIMKKWTAPIVCGVCIVLIFAMSANSFAKYYTRVQEARAAAVAVYGTNMANTEALYYREKIKSSTTGDIGIHNGVATNPTYVATTDLSQGRAKIALYNTSLAHGKTVMQYDADKNYTFNVSNVVNGNVCEVALQYTITITFPQELPVGVSWTVDNGTYYENTIKTKSFTSASYVLPAGQSTTKSHSINFKFTNTTFNVLNTTGISLDDVIIKISTTQVQQ